MVKKRNRHREPVGGRQMGTKMYTGAEVTPLLLILKLKSQSTLSIQKTNKKTKTRQNNSDNQSREPRGYKRDFSV